MDETAAVNRRQFVTGALAVLTCAGVTSCAGTEGGGGPAVFIQGPVDIGTVAAYPTDGPYDTYAKSHGFFVLRRQGKIAAASVICTHRRCTVEKEKSELVCPCHGSRFDGSGTPLEGPASKPLPLFGISVNPNGRIVVDPTKVFEVGGWNQPGAFVAV